MKKIIALFLVLTFFCLLPACGGKPEPELTAGAEPTTAETVTVSEGTDLSDPPAAGAYKAFALSEAEYPAYPKYPTDEDYADFEKADELSQKWYEYRQTVDRDYPDATDISAFTEKTVREFLSGRGKENAVFSPLNVYLALAMLAETTDGNSRAQLLSLLGAEDIDSLRAGAKSLWNRSYLDDGTAVLRLADSLWLRDSYEYKQETLDVLKTEYYSSVFSGIPGSTEYDGALRSWLDEQTGGLLKNSTRGVALEPSSVLALASTVYFNARWSEQFREEGNTQKTFRGADGDRDAVFMNREDFFDYTEGERFSAVSQWFINAGSMRFILPQEGVTPEELLSDEDFYEYINSSLGSEQRRVAFSVPKFDVSGDLQLREGLEKLGVTDIFSDRADFSPLTEKDELFVGQALHSARVTIDEEGCLAAAFTLITVDATAMIEPEEPIDFTLDRPFLFVINTNDGAPLFVGIVNNV